MLYIPPPRLIIPTWFDRGLGLRGVAGKSLLLVWCVTVQFLVMAYLCNLHTMLLLPQYQSPIDTNKQLVLSGRAPRVHLDMTGGGAKWFGASLNPWDMAVAKSHTPDTLSLEEGTQQILNGTHCALFSPDIMNFILTSKASHV